MGIEPTSEAWEVLNIPIPFSSQRHAATSSVSQSLSSSAHARSPESNWRGTHLTHGSWSARLYQRKSSDRSVGRVGRFTTFSKS